MLDLKLPFSHENTSFSSRTPESQVKQLAGKYLTGFRVTAVTIFVLHRHPHMGGIDPHKTKIYIYITVELSNAW